MDVSGGGGEDLGDTSAVGGQAVAGVLGEVGIESGSRLVVIR